jgi:hypothetical protein
VYFVAVEGDVFDGEVDPAFVAVTAAAAFFPLLLFAVAAVMAASENIGISGFGGAAVADAAGTDDFLPSGCGSG